MKPTRLIHLSALGVTLVVLLAACATSADTASEAPEGAPSTVPARVSTPWNAPFPNEPGERLWTPRSEGDNVVAHRGVLLRADRGWYFYPATISDARVMMLRARSTTGAAQVDVYLLPSRLGFTEDVLTPEYVQRALRRVLSGRGGANSDLFRVEGGAEGELVFLAREQGGLESSILVRAIPSSRGLYILTASGDTPRDYRAASGVAGSFEQVDEEVSLRIPAVGPAFFSRWQGAAWITDSREGSIYSVPGRELLLVSAPGTELRELPPGESLSYVSKGSVVEASLSGLISSGTSFAVQLTPEGEETSLLLIGASSAGSTDQVMRESLLQLTSRYMVDRESALEALR